MSTQRLPIEEHPDIASLRGRYERIGESRVVQAAAALAVLVGMFIALAPWIVGFSAQSGFAVNNVVVGLVAAALAAGFASAFRTTHGLSWVLPVLGVWTIVSPWLISGADAGTGMIVSNVVSGVVLTILGLGICGFGFMHRRG